MKELINSIFHKRETDMTNKKSRILPVVYPTLTSLPGYANALAILLNYEKTYNWVYSHYIQIFAVDKAHRDKNDPDPMLGSCFCDFDSRRLATIANDFNFLKRDGFCPFLNTFEIGNDLLIALRETFGSFIKHCIDASMYVYTYLDVSQIKEYNIDNYYCHTVFIYGYNDKERLFYYADFGNNHSSKYKFSKCTYEEIEKAFYSMNDSDWPPVKSVATIQYTDIMTYNLDFSYIKTTIRDYISPIKAVATRFDEYITSLYGPFGWKTKTFLGVDYYTYLALFIEHELFLGSDQIDRRLYHALYDHKEMMVKRLEYLMKNGYLNENKLDMITSYKIVSEKTLNIRNMILKYNASKNNNLISKIHYELSETKELEVNLLADIFEL